jgi:hypothetical protein
LIEKLRGELEHKEADIRAETVLALALENGLLPNDFIITPDSFFHREYSKDISEAEVVETVWNKRFLQVHLTRSGIYDQLPEGLFYQPLKNVYSTANAASMAAEYKINKRKEQEVRRFFKPFENDFFWQRIQLEGEEMKLLEGVQAGILNDYFIDFWNLPSSMPQSYIISLIRLMPYAATITGSPAVVAQCLQVILQESISVKVASAPVVTASTDTSLVLGSQVLGTDMVCGGNFNDDFPVLEFCIGPLVHSGITDYLEGGDKEEFLKTFYSFFTPVEADVTTKILVAPENETMLLQSETAPILGYSTVL